MFNEMECDGSVLDFYEDSIFRDYILWVVSNHVSIVKVSRKYRVNIALVSILTRYLHNTYVITYEKTALVQIPNLFCLGFTDGSRSDKITIDANWPKDRRYDTL